MIQLRGVVSVLGRFPALAGVDLDVGAGEVVLAAGPNGAGKTTLLRVCAGLLAPTGGTAVVLGRALPADRRGLRRRVAWLGHANALYDDLTALENVRFWARAAGRDGSDAAAALERMNLATRLHPVAVGRLSAGQRRRVALAALVVRRPELWLLDEPHAGLDGEARDGLDALLGEAATGGATIVFASHEVERGRALATRTVTLAGGVVVADDLEGAVGSARAGGLERAGGQAADPRPWAVRRPHDVDGTPALAGPVAGGRPGVA